MRNLFLKCFLFLSIILFGIYLSLPFILAQSFEFISGYSNYEINLYNFKNKFFHIEIEKIDIVNKETKEKITFSDCSCLLSLIHLVKGEIQLQDFKIAKIQKDNFIFDHIKGKITGNFFNKSLVGELFSPLIKTISFKLKYNQVPTAIVSAEIEKISQENFYADLGLINLELNQSQIVETKLIFKNVSLYGKSLETLMVSATGQYLNSINVKNGKMSVLSNILNSQGDFNLQDKILSYKVFANSSLISFLGSNTLHFEGKYSLLNQKNNSLFKLSFYNDKKMELIGKLNDSYLTFLPEAKNFLKISLDPFFIEGNIDLTLKSFDYLENILIPQSDKAILKIKGSFEKEKYDFLLDGKKLLLFSSIKASDLKVKLSGKKENGFIDVTLFNKEKTNLNLKTDYLFDPGGLSLSKLFFDGNYRGTSIVTEKANLYLDFNDNIKGDAFLKIGSKGSIIVQGDKKKFSLKAENIPIILLNNMTKHQNIIFEDGFINLDGNYLAGSQDFLDLKAKTLNVKSSLFDNTTLGQMNAHLLLKDGVLNSQIQADWNEKTRLSFRYTTKNLSKINLENIYSDQHTSFDLNGTIMIDGFSDLFHMYDDTFSGQVKLFAQKKEREGIFLTGDLDNGYFNNGFFNTEVKDIKARIRKDLTTSEVNFLLKGNDKEIGTITAEGKCSIDFFKKHYDLKGKLTLALFQWLNLENFQGSGTGILNFFFTPTEKKVNGSLKIDHILGYMVPKQESAIIDIKIKSQEFSQELKEETLDRPNFDIIWDIYLNAQNNNIRFYGNGLDSFWNGQVRLGGTFLSPKLHGRIDASKGYFVIAGKKLLFTEGSLLCNNDMSPQIRVVANSSDNNIKAKIIYHGLLWNPVLDLVSIPALPREEIISQIIFSKSASQIKSTARLIQLTDAIAIFNGHHIGVTLFLDKMQQIFGLDEIGIREDSINSLFLSPTADQNQSVFSAMKNLGSNVFVKAERSLSVSTPDSKTRGIIGIKVIPDVSLEIIGEQSDAPSKKPGESFGYGIGLEWKKDF